MADIVVKNGAGTDEVFYGVQGVSLTTTGGTQEFFFCKDIIDETTLHLNESGHLAVKEVPSKLVPEFAPLDYRVGTLETIAWGGVKDCGAVGSYEELPTTMVNIGDSYFVVEDDVRWCWNGSRWFEYNKYSQTADIDNSSIVKNSENKLSLAGYELADASASDLYLAKTVNGLAWQKMSASGASGNSYSLSNYGNSVVGSDGYILNRPFYDNGKVGTERVIYNGTITAICLGDNTNGYGYVAFVPVDQVFAGDETATVIIDGVTYTAWTNTLNGKDYSVGGGSDNASETNTLGSLKDRLLPFGFETVIDDDGSKEMIALFACYEESPESGMSKDFAVTIIVKSGGIRTLDPKFLPSNKMLPDILPSDEEKVLSVKNGVPVWKVSTGGVSDGYINASETNILAQQDLVFTSLNPDSPTAQFIHGGDSTTDIYSKLYQLEIGETYYVLWNDKEYECTGMAYPAESEVIENKVVLLGNLSLGNSSWTDSGEPFCIQVVDVTTVEDDGSTTRTENAIIFTLPGVAAESITYNVRIYQKNTSSDANSSFGKITHKTSCSFAVVPSVSFNVLGYSWYKISDLAPTKEQLLTATFDVKLNGMTYELSPTASNIMIEDNQCTAVHFLSNFNAAFLSVYTTNEVAVSYNDSSAVFTAPETGTYFAWEEGSTPNSTLSVGVQYDTIKQIHEQYLPIDLGELIFACSDLSFDYADTDKKICTNREQLSLISLHPGEPYTVYWDNTAYSVNAKVWDDGFTTLTYLGNLFNVGMGLNTGEPFLLITDETASIVLTQDHAPYHSIRVYKNTTPTKWSDIAGRPFGTLNEMGKVFIPKQDIAFSLNADSGVWDTVTLAADESYAPIEIDKEYIVSWNGKTYAVKANSYMTLPFLGNPAYIYGDTTLDNGLPFLVGYDAYGIIGMQNSYIVICAESTEDLEEATHIIAGFSVTGSTNVVKIPANLYERSNWDEIDESQSGYIKNKPFGTRECDFFFSQEKRATFSSTTLSLTTATPLPVHYYPSGSYVLSSSKVAELSAAKNIIVILDGVEYRTPIEANIDGELLLAGNSSFLKYGVWAEDSPPFIIMLRVDTGYDSVGFEIFIPHTNEDTSVHDISVGVVCYKQKTLANKYLSFMEPTNVLEALPPTEIAFSFGASDDTYIWSARDISTDESTYTKLSEADTALVILDGKEYVVNVLNEETTGIANNLVLGNPALNFKHALASTGEPFCLIFEHIETNGSPSYSWTAIVDDASPSNTTVTRNHTLQIVLNPDGYTVKLECLPVDPIYSSIVLRSSTEGSSKKFRLTVDDNGTLSVTEVTA